MTNLVLKRFLYENEGIVFMLKKGKATHVILYRLISGGKENSK
ncbi:hypothetical protein [Paenibacillus sp.]|nr:hypothetical protein [Paenibacillus sp.]